MTQLHPTWQDIVEESYGSLNFNYRKFLEEDESYFPNYSNFLNAFKTLSLENAKYILFGQDPYPREKSAIGYAFIDGMVEKIFSKSGLSKKVNRATSLRNFIKMLLVANGVLDRNNTSKEEIARINTDAFIKDIMDLKNNFEKNGILLLNTSLIFTCKKDTSLHVKEFLPFMDRLLQKIKNKDIELILFGNMAKMIEKKLPITKEFKIFRTQHPYNVGFIKDSSVIDFFKPMNLLLKQ